MCEAGDLIFPFHVEFYFFESMCKNSLNHQTVGKKKKLERERETEGYRSRFYRESKAKAIHTTEYPFGFYFLCVLK